MSGANASPIGRSDKEMSGANASPIGRSDKEMAGPGNVIGVACNDGEKDLVREFFQLFKTPWEFYRPEHRYPVVVSTLPRLTDVKTSLLVIYSSAPDGGVTEDAADAEDTYLEHRDASFPIYGKVRTFDSGGVPVV